MKPPRERIDVRIFLDQTEKGQIAYSIEFKDVGDGLCNSYAFVGTVADHMALIKAVQASLQKTSTLQINEKTTA